ncbi:MAG: hypothetical protein AAF614_15030 [Chloroflexota bacterium]
MQSITIATEAILTAVFTAPVSITEITQITEAERRNSLWRCHLQSADSTVPETVIVKKTESDAFDPNDVDSFDAKRFYLGWAGLALIQRVAPEANYSSRFYGGSAAEGLIVMEDLGDNEPSLVEPLLEGNAAEAEHVLRQAYLSLAEMHRDTLGKTAVFDQILRKCHPKMTAGSDLFWLPGWRERLETKLPTFVPLEPNFMGEVNQLFQNVTSPGPFWGYAHKDPCPDNFIRRGSRYLLIDFEISHFSSVLVDAVYARMTFPTCWCASRVPDGLVASLEADYRKMLAQTHPVFADDALFNRALVEACGYWFLQHLHWLLTLDVSGEWGIASIKSRILSRLQAFAELAEAHDCYPALRGTASRLVDKLTTQWPETDPLPLYPAFRQT